MNNRVALQRIEAMVDESGFVATLVDGAQRELRGLKTNTEMIRLLVIGLMLAIQQLKTATISGVYLALTENLDLRDQLRLKIKTGPGPRDFFDRNRLYYAAEFLTTRLAYGASVEGSVDEDERRRRREVLLNACNALLDYTSQATDVDDSTLAIDATAVWAWARFKYYPKPTTQEIEAQEDEIIREELRKLSRPKRRGDDTSDLDGAEVATSPSQIAGCDRDASWSGATDKNGGTKRFFGYYAHVICAVPKVRITDNPTTLAPIVRRVEVTRSTEDVVPVTLRMIDSLPGSISTILVDRHYSYKQFARWGREILQRGIRQVLDLRKSDYDTITIPEGIGAAGCLHCPATPRELFKIQRPGVFASREEHEQFQKRMDERARYSFQVINAMDKDRRIKLSCPAEGPKVACPNRPLSMKVVAERDLPIVDTSLLELESGEEAPRCCTQGTFRVQLPEPVAKLHQANYWGGRDWYSEFGRRSYVEGAFGNLKNPRTENLKRGMIQKTGIAWAQIVVTLACATYNVRIIRERHARLGLAWEGHPLLTSNADTITHVSVSSADERRLCDAFFDGMNIEDLEVHVPTSCDTMAEPNLPAERRAQRIASVLPFWLHSNSRGFTSSTGSR